MTCKRCEAMNLNAIISITIGSVIMAVVVVSMGMWYWGECSRTFSCPGFLKCMSYPGDNVCITYSPDNTVCKDLHGSVSGSGTREEMQQVARMAGMKLSGNYSFHGYMMLTDCYRTYFITAENQTA